MKLKELVYANRSYRRFDETHYIDEKTLMDLVDLGRMSPCGGNVQSLRYMLSYDEKTNEAVFKTLGWAVHLKGAGTPCEGERPTAYVVMLNKTEQFPNAWTEAGIAAQSILLGAAELGLGGCMFRNIQRDQLKETLKISDEYEILMVLAIGKPIEVIQLEVLEEGGDFKYWRDEEKVHHLPKRKLEDLIIRTI